VFNEENNRIFFEHQIILQAVFDKSAINRNNTYKELTKDEFINVLREAEILREKKSAAVAVEEGKGGANKKKAAAAK